MIKRLLKQKPWSWLFVLFVFVATNIFPQQGINLIGSFEQTLPSYWKKGAEPTGATLSWTTDQFRSMGRCLKIEKTGTGEEAYWESENMCDLWSPTHSKDVDIFLGAYVRTEGVNTNPATDADRWWISYTFYGMTGNFIGEIKLPIDQSTASSGSFVADTNAIGSTILPEDSYTTIVKFVAGANATGTVWADDFMFLGRNGAWAGQDWNTQVGVPTGWFYWLPPVGGNDGRLDSGYENTTITNEEAYHGQFSLKFDNLPGTHDGFVGTIRYPLGPDVQVGDKLRITVWLKGKDLDPANVIAVGDQAKFGITPIFHDQSTNNGGWGEIWSSDVPLTFPAATQFDWKPYYVDVTVVENAVSLSIRMHPLGQFKGTVYCDYLTVEKLDVPLLSEIGSFEQTLPSYWKKGAEPSGATLSWATDQSRSMGRSLKIEKTTSGEEAYWESENMCDLWSPTHSKDVDIFLGAYVRTEGVNTNPATDADKWWISYTFYGTTGNLIGEVKLPIDQSAPSNAAWVADTNAIASVILPEDAFTTIVKFVAGANATGTVWADDFMFYGRNGAWAGQDWNTQVGVPTGWFYWLPPVGGNDGNLNSGYENTTITDEEAYHGVYSLKFDNLPGTHDGFVGTVRYPLTTVAGRSDNTSEFNITDVAVGDVLRISVWLKGKDLDPANVAAVGDQAKFAITPIFHNTLTNNEGWGEIWSSDIPLTFPATTAFDWKQYYVDVTVVENAKSLSVRMHPLGRFMGTVYCDNLTVEKLDVPPLSAIGSFEQTLPSYWKKGAEPTGATLSWATDQSRSMGRSLKIEKTATGEEAYWESENMCDLWSPTHSKDVDIFLGAYVRTQGVNINPATDAERWWISYTFYGQTGNLIGEIKLPIDQAGATIAAFVADTNAIGSTILPEDSYTTIIKFVAGANATGTVWADDFMFYGRNGAWAGQDWNTQVGVPTGWFYWLPPLGGNDGRLDSGYENTTITNEEAYHGTYSLKFDNLPGTHDGFVGTVRYPLAAVAGRDQTNDNINLSTYDISELTDVVAGDMIRVSVWLKGKDLNPANVTEVGDQAKFGITPIFHNTLTNNEGWGEIWSSDIPLTFPATTAFDWMQFYVDVVVVADAKSLSVRMHPLGRFMGTVYCDLLEVKKLDLVGVPTDEITPATYALFQNYPNPFNPSTVLSFALPKEGFVTLKIYDILGREVKSLVSSDLKAGIHNITWDGNNNYGMKVSTGTYIYRIQAGDFVQSKKMILLK
ncbi:MAG: T9SS type A sorting domain-containing protein [bacterium]